MSIFLKQGFPPQICSSEKLRAFWSGNWHPAIYLPCSCPVWVFDGIKTFFPAYRWCYHQRSNFFVGENTNKVRNRLKDLRRFLSDYSE